MEKKSKLLITSVIFTVIMVIAILVMSYFIYKLSNDKNTAENKVNELTSEINDLQNNSNIMKQKLDAIANIINSNNIVETNTVNNNSNNNEKNTTNTIETNTSTSSSSKNNTDTKSQIENNQITSIPNNTSSNENKTIKFEFSSIDKTPSGEPRILKVFELNEDELNFSYSSGIDFATYSPNRVINGIAKANTEHLYEFEEEIPEHKYKLVFKISRS